MVLVQTFKQPELAIYSYVLVDEASRRAIVVDPVRDVEQLLGYCRREGLQIDYIVETHVHADFLSGAKELKSRCHGQPLIACSAEGGAEWLPRYCDRPVRDGDALPLGSHRLVARHTPGHTPEHVIWLLSDDRGHVTDLFSGDLLFVGSVGRPDLLGVARERVLALQLYETLFRRLDDIADAVRILPAHGAGSLCGKAIGAQGYTTMGAERRHNPALQQKPFEAWLQELQYLMPASPSYFATMKKLNVSGVPLLKELEEPALLQHDAVAALPLEGIELVDLRAAPAFAEGHHPRSINIPLNASFCHWAGIFVRYDRPVYLLCDDLGQAMKAKALLRNIGLDAIAGVVPTVEVPEGLFSQKLPYIEAHELLRQGGYRLVDVRTPQEWQGRHLPEAMLLQMALLPAEASQRLAKGQPLALLCGSGARAAVATSWLIREGYDAVTVAGGMAAVP